MGVNPPELNTQYNLIKTFERLLRLKMNRRGFIQIIAVSAAEVMLPIKYIQAESEEKENSVSTFASERSTLKPATMVTPNEQFFSIGIEKMPAIDIRNWKLLITGEVERVTFLTYSDILKIEPVTSMRTLMCIGNELGGNLIGNAIWTGVPMTEILKIAGIKKGAKKVIFRCADGYSTGVPIKDALHKDAMLAYKMNNEVLPQEHGYPLRFLNPKHYGMKNPKSIVNIELTSKDYKGYWEKRGWDDVALIKMRSDIKTPQNKETIRTKSYTISGYAFDGSNHKGIAKIEVSTDDGKSWHEAEIWAQESPLTWSLWKYTWQTPDTDESAFIKVRSIAKDGTPQSTARAGSYPSGASGLHTVEIKVKRS